MTEYIILVGEVHTHRSASTFGPYNANDTFKVQISMTTDFAEDSGKWRQASSRDTLQGFTFIIFWRSY